MRLVFAIVSTLLEEAALGATMLKGLPGLGVDVPVAVAIVLMSVWLAFSVFTYRAGTRALKRKQLIGLSNMVGSEGEVAITLAPEGQVRIKGELWMARSAEGNLERGSRVTVVAQDGLKLTVRRNEPVDRTAA